MRPFVELVSTGNELLSGRTLNRHAQSLGARLAPLGLALVRDTTVGDRIEDIQDALRSALERVDVVVVTGGLGPTSDDLTPEAVAGALRRGVAIDPESLGALRRRYEKMGRTVTPSAERQARVVEGAEALSNAVGAAPGERLELNGKVIFILPGPPSEFLSVLEQHVLPWLGAHLTANRPLEKVCMVCGLGESDIVARFEQAGFAPGGVEMAYSAGPRRIEVRCRAATAAPAAFEEAALRMRALLGGHVFSETAEEIETVVGRRLAEQKKTLATAESCTGGLLGERLTSVSGSSAYYLGGVIAYADEIKRSQLGIPADDLALHGAVSPQVAQGMAARIRMRYGADFGLGITGIAGPTGGTPEKPVGLVYVALADAGETLVRRYRFGGHRERVREWSAQMALDLLRRRLEGVSEPDTFGVTVPA